MFEYSTIIVTLCCGDHGQHDCNDDDLFKGWHKRQRLHGTTSPVTCQRIKVHHQLMTMIFSVISFTMIAMNGAVTTSRPLVDH